MCGMTLPLSTRSGTVLSSSANAAQKVSRYLRYLVGLRETSYLTELQVTQVIHLWIALPEGDKEQVDYSLVIRRN